MITKNEKDDILNRFLEMAKERWELYDVDQMYNAFELVAEAIRAIETFEMSPEWEPAHPNTIYNLDKTKRNDVVECL